MRPTLLVVARAPVAGRAKTRLTPPATPEQAARIAAAALLDTLDAASGQRRVVSLTGRLADADRRPELRMALRSCRVVAQRGDTFAQRLVTAHADAGGAGPVLQVGMDTPQLHPALLREAYSALDRCDAVLGPASDGGWWSLGMHDPRHVAVLHDVPMSTSDTGALTLRALRNIGLRVGVLTELSDVDTMEDAHRVAREVPGSRFAVEVATVGTAGVAR